MERILGGNRECAEADVNTLIDVLCRLFQMAVLTGMLPAEVDINPLTVHSAGQEVRALDALVVPCE